WLQAEYRLNQSESETAALHYVEAALIDFNGNLKAQLLLPSQSGAFSLRLPIVAAQETYTLRVRAYFGETYRFAESAIGLRLTPDMAIPQPELQGLPGRVLSGSRLHLSLASDVEADFESVIRVLDDQGQLLAAGEKTVELTVPTTTERLEAVVQINDQYGHVRSIRAYAQVVQPLALGALRPGVAYDAFLPDVGSYWYSRDNRLYSQAGLEKTFEGPITALGHVGKDRKSTRLNSSHVKISYAVFCLKKIIIR